MRAWNTVFSTVALAYGVRIVDNFHFTDSRHGEPGISGDLTHFGYTGNASEATSQSSVYAVASMLCPGV